jgi:hypothetical protein
MLLELEVQLLRQLYEWLLVTQPKAQPEESSLKQQRVSIGFTQSKHNIYCSVLGF